MVQFEFPCSEKVEFNQYWYSSDTVSVIVAEMVRLAPKRVALLSTPSVWLPALQAKLHADLFDFDASFQELSAQSSLGEFVHYDFNTPNISSQRAGLYDLVLIDPPFITLDVLTAYAITCKQLLSKDGRLIISSIAENLEHFQELFGSEMRPVGFQPSVPSLVYQYTFFVNYAKREDSFFQ